MNDKANILIIDDEEALRDSCSQALQKEGYTVRCAKDGMEGLEFFKKEFFHVVLLDLRLPGLDGMEVLSKIKEESPETPVIIITAYASIESAIEAMKRGAFDYLAKPFSPEELRIVIRKALDSRNILLENIYLRKELEAKTEFDLVVGKSKAMEKVLDIVRRVSPTESTVLITGESGTGKELIARAIHKHSTRRNGPFVAVDCGALVETLFESELFGHVKGSFTGAYETKHGRFEIANGGTIFFDEIGNISLNIQAKLLRAIQEREVTRIGSSKPIKVNVRIIAATNRNLAEAVREGKFREDLFYRLSVVPIHLPPLRERKEDIPLLIEHFLQKYNKKAKKGITSVSAKVKNALMEYDWPGNIRELENTIERAVVLSRGREIEMESLMYHGISVSPEFWNLAEGKFRTLEETEKEYIKTVLQAQSGNKGKTAEILGIDRKTLWAKIKKYNLQ
ncbi:MAG: sigma-54 dependent transcriptional regulator [candidate division KSB1 bacterium]|nr:sigma-54 dependent transcriptional regulator [candidate division KSB1 bacterium]MDZ7303011.1 sigma-54 dependent transcriptional regulator [candidate division KSB1 bacterium]MDZ7312481.1 sigma-54 dependent transcriptional regulator [candidate division KSB1 bacterium]